MNPAPFAASCSNGGTTKTNVSAFRLLWLISVFATALPAADLGGQAPVATSRRVTTREDTVLTIAVTGSDADSTILTGRILSLPGLGSLLPTLDGITASAAALTPADLPFRLPDSQRRMIYRPPPDANGAALTSFTVDLDDGLHLSNPATITVDVTPVNDAPTVMAVASQIMTEDAPLALSVSGLGSGTPALRAGDPGHELQALTVSVVSDNPAVLPNPAVSYTSPGNTAILSLVPMPNAFGSANLTVTVRDAGGTADGGIDTTVITFPVTVTGINDPPRMFVPIGQILSEDQPVDITCFVYGAGPENEAAQVPNLMLIATALDPTLINVLGIDWIPGTTVATLRLQPVANATGFTWVVVTLVDDSLFSPGPLATSQLLLTTVNPVNDPPMLARNLGHAVTRGGRTTLSSSALLISDADNPPAASLVFSLITQPQHGVIEVSGVALATGGTFTQQDLNDGRVSYRHDGSSPIGELFTLAFSDGIITQPYPTVSVPVSVDGRSVPLIDLPLPGPTWREDGATVAIAPLATVTDLDTPVLSAGRLSVSVSGGTLDDRLTILNQGTGLGQIGVSGSNVRFAGRTIGTWQGGTAGQPLTVTFSGADATLTAVQALLRTVHFYHVSADPSADSRLVQVVVDDGDSGASPPATISVTVIPVDDPPVPIPVGTVTTVPGFTLEMALAASDPDSQTLTWSLISSPALATLELVDATKGLLRVITAPGARGRDVARLAVSDGVNPAVAVDLPISVVPADEPALFPAAEPPREIFAGGRLDLTVPFDCRELPANTRLDFAPSADAPPGLTLTGTSAASVRLLWDIPTNEPANRHRRFGILAYTRDGSAAGVLPLSLLVLPNASGAN